MSHSEIERELEARGRELLRVERLHTRSLKPIFGPVEVEGVGPGAEGRESLHPRAAALNLHPEFRPERAAPASSQMPSTPLPRAAV